MLASNNQQEKNISNFLAGLLKDMIEERACQGKDKAVGMVSTLQ